MDQTVLFLALAACAGVQALFLTNHRYFFAGNYFLCRQRRRLPARNGGAASLAGAVRHRAHFAGQLRVRCSRLCFSAADQIDLRRVIGL